MFRGVLNRRRAAARWGLVVALTCAGSGPALAQVAWPLVYEGRIFDDRGRPLEAPATLTFRLYDAPDGGAPLWTETLPDVVVAAGDFAVLLGLVEPLPADLPPGSSLFLGIEVDGDVEQRPRTPVGAALRARFADLAERARRLSGGVVDATELRVGGRLVVDGDGQWVGPTAGLAGPPGLACWDVDGDAVADPGEDVDGDGRLTALDCRGAGGGGDALAGLDCAVGDFVVRTAGGWACDAHAFDPDAHHSALSEGLDIQPASVRLPDGTALEAATLRLGPQNDQVLSAAALASLTGGPGMSADHLHSHAGQGAASPAFLGLTRARFTGDLGGPIGAHQKCSADYPNSHMCGYCEIMDAYPNVPLAEEAWVVLPHGALIVRDGRGSAVCGFPTSSRSRASDDGNSCGDWADARPQNVLGPVIRPNGHFFSRSCDTQHPIACCAN
ncbi:hypothetical protein L6V77_13090 [Myxococcota bacterium]|nr:hypothetical protein [Myxococcota bacterium]